MKKFRDYYGKGTFCLLSKKTIRIMKLTFFLSVLTIFQLTASESYSQKTKLTLKLENVKISEVLKEIENQSEFFFLYSPKLINVERRVNIDAKKESIKDILKKLFGNEVKFAVYDSQVLLVAKEKSEILKELQLIEIKGKVTSAVDGLPLPGVNILEKGTNNGTITNMDGEYTLKADDNAILVVSFMGYLTQEILVGGQSVINVTLEEDTKGIEEVVVIGYQTVRKKDLTGAVSVVDSKMANKMVSSSLAESLQGLSSGITVRNSGAPGQMANIEIRGAASFTNTNPLYVIDGMIADANTTINNNDIETIQILKDASASAIYGSRAANGVIIITTKQGKEGNAKFDFTAKFGVQQLPKTWDLMNNVEFAAMQLKQYENSGITPPISITTAFDPSINTDWQNEVIRNGSMQDYNFTISGGSKTNKYLLSTSYYKNSGVLIGNEFERGSIRLNSSTKRGIFTIGENLVLTNSTASSPAEGNPFYDMPQMLPIIPVQADSYISQTNPKGWGFGTVDAVNYAWNSVAVNDITSRKVNYAKAVGNAYIEAKFFDWLIYKFNVGLEVSFDNSKSVQKDGVWRFNAPIYPSTVNEYRSQFLNILYEHTINFNKSFNNHNFNGVVGISQQHITNEYTSGGRSNLQQYGGNYLSTVGSGLGAQISDGGQITNFATLGYLGRLNYNYMEKYFLSLTGRIDQDSRFGKNYRTGYFPSVAAAWKISKENFFKVPWISNLKLSASYGELGIVPLGSWDYTAYVNTNPTFVLGSGQTVNNGITQARLANNDLKWEERITKNIGIDFGFFNDRVLLTVELYNSLSKDALLQLPVAGYLGNLGGDPFVNAGSIRNKGLDMSLTYRSKGTSEFKYDATFNATTINNEVESVGNRGSDASGKVIDYIQIGNTRTQVGRSLGEWYLLKTDGLFQTQAEIDAYVDETGAKIQPDAKPGDYKYIDSDGNGIIDNNDRDFVGTPWANFQAGAQFNAFYKGFSLNIQLTGVFGNKIYNDVRRVLDSYQRTNFRSDINPWSPTNTGTSDPRIGTDNEQGIIMNNKGENERWLENGSFVRVRNLELGYSLPQSMANKIKMQNIRFTLSAQNLLTFTKYKGLDPEVLGNGIYERGLDNGNWPASRGYYFGIQFEL